MKRRDFAIALATAAFAIPACFPCRAHAQAAQRRIAWLGAGRAGTASPFLESFRAGLRDRGWIEGQNLALGVFFTEGSPEDSERLALSVLAMNPELLVTFGRDVLAVRNAKPSMPVVFAFSGNPVDAGVVKSFARPETNFTGISFMSLELAGKRIELLREVVPRVRRLAVLARPEHAGEHRERAVSEEIGAKLGLSLFYAPIKAETGLDGALRSIASQNCDALVAFPDAVMLANSRRIAGFALERQIATTSGWGGFADGGFLLTYGPNLQASYHMLAGYADRVLRGARPQELPVELPRSVELVLNTRTARALGAVIPQSILLRADRVIE